MYLDLVIPRAAGVTGATMAGDVIEMPPPMPQSDPGDEDPAPAPTKPKEPEPQAPATEASLL